MTEAPSSNPDPNHKAPAGEEPRPGARVVARLYGEPMTELPEGLYIPPDALEVVLDRFEGLDEFPIDLSFIISFMLLSLVQMLLPTFR